MRSRTGRRGAVPAAPDEDVQTEGSELRLRDPKPSSQCTGEGLRSLLYDGACSGSENSGCGTSLKRRRALGQTPEPARSYGPKTSPAWAAAAPEAGWSEIFDRAWTGMSPKQGKPGPPPR